MSILLHLCLCSPVSVHAHSLGQQELIVVRQRDKARHVLTATACLGNQIPFSGGGEWSFMCQSLAAPKGQAAPGMRAELPEMKRLDSVVIDGKVAKVKR